LRAVEESRPAGQEPLPLFASPPEAARTFLEKHTCVRLLAEPRSDAYSATFEAEGLVRLTDPSGLLLLSARQPERGAFVLDRALRDELRHRALDALALQPGTLRVEAAFRPPTAEELARWKAESGLAVAGSAEPSAGDGGTSSDARIYAARGTTAPERELALAMLDVRNPTATALHVAVLSVTEARGCALIWPPAGERDVALEPGARLHALAVNVSLPSAWPAGRPMRDRYLVIATREGVDLSSLVTGERVRSAGALPGVLANAIEGPKLRGGRAVRVDQAPWGITALDLLVQRAP
jgi:hypothetical protein